MTLIISIILLILIMDHSFLTHNENNETTAHRDMEQTPVTQDINTRARKAFVKLASCSNGLLGYDSLRL